MNLEQKIKMACTRANISQAQVSKQIGMTPSNFNQKLKRQTFTDTELKQIADVLGCEFRPCAFVFDDVCIE